MTSSYPAHGVIHVHRKFKKGNDEEFGVEHVKYLWDMQEEKKDQSTDQRLILF